MSPLRRRGLLAGVALALVAAATVGILVVAASDSDAAGGRPPRKAAGDPVVARPERHRGPQGQVGQFVVNCRYSHTAQNDPIVHFDMEGMSHSHDFYGAVSVDHTSLAEDLLDDGTTCAKKVDTASYWHPTVYLGDEAVEPLDLNAYYRAAPGVDPLDVETMPLGLALVAGDQFASEPQEGEATGWTCGTRTDVSDDPPECPQSAPLHLVLTFQDCWDGEYLDAVDQASHVAYSAGGACPATHPVHIPQLTMSVRFPIFGPVDDLRLASGNVYSAHGDFLNAWEPDGLLREIEACIHRDVVCNLGSNRGEEDLFAFGS